MSKRAVYTLFKVSSNPIDWKYIVIMDNDGPMANNFAGQADRFTVDSYWTRYSDAEARVKFLNREVSA